MPQEMTLTFRCPKELDGLLPLPMLAASGLPGWVKEMPAQAFNAASAAASLAGQGKRSMRCFRAITTRSSAVRHSSTP